MFPCLVLTRSYTRVLAVFPLVAHVHGQTFNCTEVEGQCIIGTYPDPESCAHYYYCAPGLVSGCLKLRQKCPELFAFHKDLLQCVLAIDAECNSKKKIQYENRNMKEYLLFMLFVLSFYQTSFLENNTLKLNFFFIVN